MVTYQNQQALWLVTDKGLLVALENRKLGNVLLCHTFGEISENEES